MVNDSKISVIIPAKNEADSLPPLLKEIRKLLPQAEIILVNDGSTDETAAVTQSLTDKQVTHPLSLGNGAAVKSGARAATGDILVFMDADGQHKPADIPALLSEIDKGCLMSIGARNIASHASIPRRMANTFYNKLASYMTGQRIEDLTSGFRAVSRTHFLQFINLLPNGFSYPTTITMAFFKAGFPVTYVPIFANKRVGESHIRPLVDGARFFLIIFRVGSLYSPLKIFAPASALLFAVASLYYAYTFITEGRFTNMSALFYMTSILTFFIGLVSEQVTQLLYLSSLSDKDL